MPERLDMLDINKTQVVFGSEVPLELYYQNFPNVENDKLYQLKDAAFVQFAFLTLADLDPDSIEFDNIGIRKNQNLKLNTQHLQHQFIKFGWDCKHFPPCISYNEDNSVTIIDGRTRILTALECGENFIPVAVYSQKQKSDDTFYRDIVNAVKRNNRQFSNPNVIDDIEVSAKALIKKKKLDNTDRPSVVKFLNESDVIDFFHTKTINSLIEKIMNFDVDGEFPVEAMSDDKAKRYVRAAHPEINLDKKRNNEQYVLYTANEIAAARVIVNYILPNAADGVYTKIILKCGDTVEAKANNSMKLFRDKIVNTLATITPCVNKQFPILSLPEYKCPYWEIVGVIPAKRNSKTHQTAKRRKQLMDFDNWIKASN